MANSDKSKLKTLLIYEYFMKRYSPHVDNDIMMGDIIEYLNEMTDTLFERKSVYADIERVNEFMRLTAKVSRGDDWIYHDGKKYKRGDIADELSLDEARLIVDAINATPFIDSGLCEKIKDNYPLYFDKYNSLISHSKNVSKATKFLLNNVRTCIDEERVLKFEYGYNVAGAMKGTTGRKISPLALDWVNDNYYIIAVDNNEYAKNNNATASIRRYRIDRISKPTMSQEDEYIRLPGNKSARNAALEKYVKSAIDAFSAEKSRVITIKIMCASEKDLLKAYNAFTDDVSIKKLLSDKTDKGEIKFCIEAGLVGENRFVPTLFTKLFKLYTFDGVSVEIDDEDVKAQFKEYLNRASSLH